MPLDKTEDGIVDVFHVSPDVVRKLVPQIFEQAAYEGAANIVDETRTATAWRKAASGYFESDQRIQAQIDWHPSPRYTETIVTCRVFNIGSGNRVFDVKKTGELGAAARVVINNWIAGEGIRQGEAPPHDPVVKPGEVFESFFTGTLRDYSGCATDHEIEGLKNGALPLGRYAFGFGKLASNSGPELFLSDFSTGGKMEYNGVLICAPQNSGKTVLVVRWAHAATQIKKPYPYAVFIVDVKGNLRKKLIEKKLAGDIYCFSTDPHDQSSDRINFLDGPKGLDAADSDRIQQLATALLPSRGFTEKGGVDEYHYRNRVIWLTAFIHILKLSQYYCPKWYLDDQDNERNVDLADLYELMEDEGVLIGYYQELLDQENDFRKNGKMVPARGIEHWFSELAIMLAPDPKKFPMGQRIEKDTFRAYTVSLLSALEPFAPNGTLHHRTRSFGPGRLFDLEGVLGGDRRPVTVILSARQQDLEKAETVLALTIKRLQWFLFERMGQADAEKRPILLLLDETRRIRDFDAAEYVTFARESKAACVVVYQSLDQIGRPEKITELLENVGTQIYLGSLVGNTAKYFISILPKRWRPVISRQIVRSATTETVTTNIGREQVDYLSTTDLYRLPAGRWPALIHINDLPRCKPFFVDMSDPET